MVNGRLYNLTWFSAAVSSKCKQIFPDDGGARSRRDSMNVPAHHGRARELMPPSKEGTRHVPKANEVHCEARLEVRTHTCVRRKRPGCRGFDFWSTGWDDLRQARGLVGNDAVFRFGQQYNESVKGIMARTHHSCGDSAPICTARPVLLRSKKAVTKRHERKSARDFEIWYFLFCTKSDPRLSGPVRCFTLPHITLVVHSSSVVLQSESNCAATPFLDWSWAPIGLRASTIIRSKYRVLQKGGETNFRWASQTAIFALSISDAGKDRMTGSSCCDYPSCKMLEKQFSAFFPRNVRSIHDGTFDRCMRAHTLSERYVSFYLFPYRADTEVLVRPEDSSLYKSSGDP
ncbi:hypothetical protein ARMSODRAFT_976275 [Armillaria solidipes]|uniref:Uncharacterized protein n=1 Tax=Armillaria solidipes TaxID=1076256 RepID=A0A2H3BAS1_9AGAR|nr:hypothetical protein ARMSODRAFT_976275 [Armillaria solidipes]